MDDLKLMRREKVGGNVKHEKTSGGKNIPPVLVKKKKDEKVVASNGTVAPKAQPVKSPKSLSLNGREAHVTKVTIFFVFLKMLDLTAGSFIFFFR